jgi:hypothetical protein
VITRNERKIFAEANSLIVFALTIATGVQDRPVDAPSEGPWASDWKVVGSPTFAQAMSAVASLVLSCKFERLHAEEP